MGLAYAPSLESTPVEIAPRYEHFIGGKWVPSEDGATFATIDPATEETLAEIAVGTPADVARALHATARGLKFSSDTRQDFVKGMTAAARMFCAPLNANTTHPQATTPQGMTHGSL